MEELGFGGGFFAERGKGKAALWQVFLPDQTVGTCVKRAIAFQYQVSGFRTGRGAAVSHCNRELALQPVLSFPSVAVTINTMIHVLLRTYLGLLSIKTETLPRTLDITAYSILGFHLRAGKVISPNVKQATRSGQDAVGEAVTRAGEGSSASGILTARRRL